MRARFSDPQGPRRWRFAPFLVPILMILTGFFGPWSGMTAVLITLGGFLGLNVAGMIPTRQRKLHAVELVCGPGYVDVKGSTLRAQRLTAKQIMGATTARTRSGVLLTMTHARRADPLTLELDSEAEAERVRQSLGIGHGGVGTIAWHTRPSTTVRQAYIARAITVATALLFGLSLIPGSTGLAMVTGIVGSCVAIVTSLFGVLGLFARAESPTVVMALEGLRLWTTQGWFTIPYGGVLDVREEPGRLVFVVPPPHREVTVETVGPWSGQGITADEAHALVSQIRTASARARGHGPQKNDVTGRVEVLRRGGESPQAWLARLDVAGQMLATGSGYRGNTLDTEDLWTVLEDPEADSELRVAAARVLRHSGQPEARIRIDAAVAAVRDEHAHKKLRVAVEDDVESAGAELAAIEARTARYAHRVRY
jgi:hypothetical protein